MIARVVVITLAACAGLAVGVVASTPPKPQAVAPEGAVAVFPTTLRQSGPDKFGVVCYTFGERAVSCVQVEPSDLDKAMHPPKD